MITLTEDLSLLTNVSEQTLKKFIPFINYSICHAVFEDECENNSVTEIDLGFGVLLLKNEGSTLRYRFIPSKELEKNLIQTVARKTSPIIQKAEDNLQDKLQKAYKELL